MTKNLKWLAFNLPKKCIFTTKASRNPYFFVLSIIFLLNLMLRWCTQTIRCFENIKCCFKIQSVSLRFIENLPFVAKTS
jgi:hypothetical protein